MDSELFEELYRLREECPQEAIARVAELGDSIDERVIASVILIDCGDALNNVDAVSDGVNRLTKVFDEIGYNSNICYNLANGLQLRARLNPEQKGGFSGQASDDRFKARVLFGMVMGDAAASAEIRSQMLTNIGILFLETHRWVEAIDCFQHAQKIFPTNAVAAFQEMRRAMGLANLFVRDAETYQSYCNVDALLQRVRVLADVVNNNLDVVREFAGAAAVEAVQRAADDAKNIVPITEQRSKSPYFSFVRNENLALSLYCSSEEFADGRFDLLTIPYISGPFSDGPNVPEIFAMINVLKSDFAFARQIMFDVREYDSDTPFFETTSHGDTLDYAVYGVRYSALTIAQRIAFDVLDKIAVAFATYLKIPDASAISFTALWGRMVKGKGFVPSPVIEAELQAGNPPLIALYNVFQDISKDSSRGDGFMGAQRQYRNSSTHRFTVLHDMKGHNKLSPSQAIEHKDITEFERLTMESLRLARACLFYFVDAVVFIENRNRDKDDKIVISEEVPDHDYIRGRKNRP